MGGSKYTNPIIGVCVIEVGIRFSIFKRGAVIASRRLDPTVILLDFPKSSYICLPGE